MRKKVIIVCGVVVLILLVVCGILYTQLYNSKVDFTINNNGKEFPLNEKQKVEDFEYLYNSLKDSFPYFEVKKREFGLNWLSKKDEFTQMIKSTKDDKEFFDTLSQMLSLLQNGHTNLIYPGEEYTDYKRLYSGPQPWAQIYNNKKVSNCYDYWNSIIKENDSSYIHILFKYVEGKYYVIENSADLGKQNDNLGIPVGAQLEMVNGVDVNKYIENLKNEKFLKFDRIRNKFKLNTFNIMSKTNVDLLLRLPTGEEILKKETPYSTKVENSTPGQKLPEHLFSTEIIEKDKIAYLRIPSLDAFYVDKDKAGIENFLKKVSRYDKLIIDIRGNGGGSTNYWQNDIVPLLIKKELSTKNYVLYRDSKYIKPFIKAKLFNDYFGLKNLDEVSFNKQKPGYYFADNKGLFDSSKYKVSPKNSVGFNGKIYLLVDDYVYSSAEAFASFAKATKWATLVGRNTGGDGIGFDPVPIVLPNSGLVVRFPADMGLNTDGTVNEEIATAPDVYIEQSYDDFLKQIEVQKKNSKKIDIKTRISFDTVLRKTIEMSN